MDRRTHLDWSLLAIATLIWSSAYIFTNMAVNKDDLARGLPPELVISARLTIGAIILLAITPFLKQKWPPLSDWRAWLVMMGMGIAGTMLPFLLISTAQQTIDAGLAALYVAAEPLFVVVMAHFMFTDDRLNNHKIIGVIVGFIGVAVLFGPDAVKQSGSTSISAQSLCLLATICYATSVIIARYGKSIPPLVFAAGFLSFGAVASWAMLPGIDFGALQPDRRSLLAVIALGVGPTAIASLIYMVLIQRTSASFLALVGYTIPISSACLGYLIFSEIPSANAILAIILILSGVWYSQGRSSSATAAVEND